jgi:hypothetical protein
MLERLAPGAVATVTRSDRLATRTFETPPDRVAASGLLN